MGLFRTLFAGLAFVATSAGQTLAQAADDVSVEQGEPLVVEEIEFPDTEPGAGTLSIGSKVKGEDFAASVQLTMLAGPLGLQSGVCSGTVIAPRLVLTAAHCLRDGDNVLVPKVTVKLRDLGSGSKTMTVVTKGSVAIPKAYKRWTTGNKIYDSGEANDLALIRLPETVPDADKRVARLPKNAAEAGGFHFLVGQGQTIRFSASGEPKLGVSGTLLYAGVRLKKESDVMEGEKSNDFPNSVGNTRIVLWQTKEIDGRDVPVVGCYGDSGGSLYAAQNVTDINQPDRLILIGVISRIDSGPNDFQSAQFASVQDPDHCASLGVGTIAVGTLAKSGTIAAMATALGEPLN